MLLFCEYFCLFKNVNKDKDMYYQLVIIFRHPRPMHTCHSFDGFNFDLYDMQA